MNSSFLSQKETGTTNCSQMQHYFFFINNNQAFFLWHFCMKWKKNRSKDSPFISKPRPYFLFTALFSFSIFNFSMHTSTLLQEKSSTGIIWGWAVTTALRTEPTLKKKRFSGDITVLHFSFTVTALICFGFSHTDLEACQKPTGNYQSLGKNVHSLTGWQVLAVAWLKWSQGSMRDVRTGFVIKSKLNTHWSKIKLND